MLQLCAMTTTITNNNSAISATTTCSKTTRLIPIKNNNRHSNHISNDTLPSSSPTKPGAFIMVMTKKHVNHYHPPGARPLPSVLTDFLTLTLCDLMPCRMNQDQEPFTVPGLLGFVQRVTTEANISCHEAVVALIYIERCKEALPKNVVGDKDTAHRIFVAAVLVACKFLQGSTWSHSSQRPLTNAQMAKISSIYSPEQINQLERSFLNLIKHRCWVDDEIVQAYLSNHRQDLLL